MTDLLTDVLAAHGGVDRWQRLKIMQASIVTAGEFWGMKGLVQDPAPREMTVSLHEERASVQPYGAPDQRTSFTPDHVAIEKLDGKVVAERHKPAAFEGHDLTAPWDPPHRATFNCYAPWTYPTTPFFLTVPGFDVVEIQHWHERHER